MLKKIKINYKTDKYKFTYFKADISGSGKSHDQEQFSVFGLQALYSNNVHLRHKAINCLALNGIISLLYLQIMKSSRSTQKYIQNVKILPSTSLSLIKFMAIHAMFTSV